MGNNDDAIAEWEKVDKNVYSDDWRCAIAIHKATGILPFLEDTGGKQGAVDLRIWEPGQEALIEVTTTTIDPIRKQNNFLYDFIEKVRFHYTGNSRWVLSFGHGWHLAPKKQQKPEELAIHLKSLESTMLPPNEGKFLIDEVFGVRVLSALLISRNSGQPWISSSLSTNAEHSSNYALNLQRYLHNDTVVRRKREKLASQSLAHGVDQKHLFLLVVAFGPNSNLLPIISPYSPWEDLELPLEIDTVWLEGGTGTLACFSRGEGWKFFEI
ncbi:hypothetical protein QBL02_13095 [Leucobacter sp. UT-8R-CII-1-4]|uniref:hypothetical protein n=1 Tax=Leucobacter sp. UT-8R-CII-1-4 TaxID=3040075 RepID=UPI0024A91C7D|nr:hypothetical protein [Leucobacter sp. UT-8R-CII-1-4]MDI6024477.1 hypothetical protein [Leucobacter sp. UT-8R-CII-1-4]